MTIIFGGGSKMKNPGGLWVPYLCRGCDGMAAFAIVENYKYGHVYGVRVAKYKSKYFLICSTCQRTYVIDSKERFHHAQEIARRIAATPEQQLDLFREIGNVARFVLNEPDIAASIERTAVETPANEIEASIATPPNEDNKTCPDCAESVKTAARRCRFCGHEFEPVV